MCDTKLNEMVALHSHRCGMSASCVVADNGEVFVFGEGLCGQLGVGKPYYSRYPRRLPAPLNAEFVDIGAGDTTSYAVTSACRHQLRCGTFWLCVLTLPQPMYPLFSHQRWM